MMNRPSVAGDFTGDDHPHGGYAPASEAVILEKQLNRIGIVGSGIEVSECDERIRAVKRHYLQRVGQRHTHHRADAHNGLRARERLGDKTGHKLGTI